MKAFLYAVAAMVVITFGAGFSLNALDQTVGEKYSVGDVPAN